MNFIIPAVLDMSKEDLYFILLDSVKSIIKFEKNPEIFILVNNSNPLEEWIQSIKEVGNIRIIVWPEEVSGFARACNLAIEYSEFSDFILMNSDVLLIEPISDKIYKAVGDNPKFGAIFPHWLEYSDSDIEYERGFGVASGSFFYTTYKIMRSIGFFSTEYKVGFFEDRDLWLKMLYAGYELIRIRKSRIRHLGNSTVKYYLTNDIINRNKELFKRKWSKIFPNITATF